MPVPLPSAVFVAVLLALSCCSSAKNSSRSPATSAKKPFWTSDTSVCRNTPGLTKAQMKLCYQQPDTTAVALRGLEQAVKECQDQFTANRWNCSSLSTRSNIPHNSPFLKQGFRETAYAYAISSASVVINVARACSQNSLPNSCSCESKKYNRVKYNRNIDTTAAVNAVTASEWKWGGCSHNLRHGIRFAKKFLDSRETMSNSADMMAAINLHNNNVGRSAVRKHVQLKCKCHGMSGSCQLKTCWRLVSDLRTVAKHLKDLYKNAVMVELSNGGNRLPERNEKKKVQKKKVQRQWLPLNKKKRKNNLNASLLFYQKSPSFCDPDPALEIPGTSGRFCNNTGSGSDSCANLCCGKGYNLIRIKDVEKCNCKFHWCCEVRCDICHIDEWRSFCK